MIAAPSFRLDLPRGRHLDLEAGVPRIMGIVNVTPDSFSDGGRFLDPEPAVAHALRLIEDGADVVDLGAESTRPGGGIYGDGAREVPASEEIDRLQPVLESLRRETDAVISVDTRKGAVARASLAAGADLINDVGGLRDPELMSAVAASGCPVVVMHSRGETSSMQRDIDFADVAREVGEELEASIEPAIGAGVERRQIILDPGIGFGKTADQNLDLLCRFEPLHRLGMPILIGASRKSFIAAVSAPADPTARIGGSLAAMAWATRCGASLLRVHDVYESRQFLDVWHAIRMRQTEVQ